MEPLVVVFEILKDRQSSWLELSGTADTCKGENFVRNWTHFEMVPSDKNHNGRHISQLELRGRQEKRHS